MRVAVTGGRDFADEGRVRAALTQVDLQQDADEDLTLICGMARGADMLAHRVAKSLGWKLEEFPADWDRHGKAAGALRNQQMVDAQPSLCLAFPGDTGTADMLRRVRAAGIRVIEG